MKKNSQNPKVSIICPTYNHEKFIAQALDSFIMQECEFDFEVIVGEDCSTDKTREIVENYAQKYPKLIKPIYQSVNSGGYKNVLDTFNAASGEYFIFCEGDDFFLDKNKLQIQADYLDKHAQCSLCFHYGRVFWEDKSQGERIHPSKSYVRRFKDKFNYESLKNSNFMCTASCMFRRYEGVGLDDIMPNGVLFGDWYAHFFYTRLGEFGFIPRMMSAYRRHSGGLTYFSQDDGYFLKYGLFIVNFWHKGGELFPNDKQFWLKGACNEYNKAMQIYLKHRAWGDFDKMRQNFPTFSATNITINDDATPPFEKKYKKYKKISRLLIILCGFLIIISLFALAD